MPTSKEFKEAQARRLALEEIGSDWTRVSQLITDNRLDDALEVAREIIPRTDALGDGYTTTNYPVCLGCNGLAERDHPDTRGLRVSCYIGEVSMKGCPGNTYGRMHPTQVVDYIENILRARRPAEPGEPEPAPEPDPEPGDPEPAPEPEPEPAAHIHTRRRR